LDREKLNLQKILLALNPQRYFYLGAILVFGAYLRPIFSEWVYSDEYHLFADDSQARDHFNKDGSLVGGLLYTNISRNLVSSPTDLWRLRLLSIVCLLLVLKHIAKAIYAKNTSSLIQFILPLSLLLPAPMTFISWSLMWQGSFAIFVSFFACAHWLNSKSANRLIAIPILCCALLISPYSAFTCIGFFAGIEIITKANVQDILKRFLLLLKLFSASGITTSAVVYCYSKLSSVKLNDRVDFIELGEVPSKIFWIISRPITISTRFFDIGSPNSINAIIVFSLVLTVILVGIVNLSSGNLFGAFQYITFFFTSTALTLIPIIITSSNQIEFRYIFASSWMFFCVFVFFLFELISKYSDNTKLVTKLGILVILITGTLTVNLNFERQFLSPYQSKVDFLKTRIQECKKSGKNLQRIEIVPPKKAFPDRKNIGMYSQVTDLASSWVPVPSVESILLYLDMEVSKVTMMKNRNLGDAKNCQIDLEGYRKILVKSSQVG
jgi:hypothetical protein